MVRQKVKGTGHKQPADAKTEPNFYLMPVVGEPNTTLHGFQQHDSMEPQVHYTTAGIVETEPSADSAAITAEETTSAPVSSDGFFSSFGRNMYSRLPPVTLGPMSPMSPGMRGAAHLLQGIAAGHAGTLSMPMESLSDSHSKLPTDDSDPPGTSFLQPRISSSSSFHATYDKDSTKKSWS
jgi:hypothetical protein